MTAPNKRKQIIHDFLIKYIVHSHREMRIEIEISEKNDVLNVFDINHGLCKFFINLFRCM